MPSSPKTHTISCTIPQLLPYISWGYFFHAWSMDADMATISTIHDCPACIGSWVRRSPAERQAQARAAANLWQDAQQMLRVWATEERTATCRVMIMEAWSEDEDIVLPEIGLRLPMLRQQHSLADAPCLCLADFIAPKGCGIADRMGLFASTADAVLESAFPDDPYRHMLAQTLADRLAEAAAEFGHMMTRRNWWGYAADEQLSITDMLSARYQGIRPAVGYPSLPDQSLNFLLADILDFNELGISLTESGAMRPHASTSGLMLAHPKASYFAIGPIGDDQLQDYARRRSTSPEALRRFLRQ